MPRTRSQASSEMEHLNKYDLLRTTTTQEEEPLIIEPEMNGWNAFQSEQKKLEKKLQKKLNKADIAKIWKSMPKEEKLKYGNKQPKVKVLVRCRTKHFVDTLEKLGPERRKWLEDTPFQKLLMMERHIQNNVMIKKLAALFNTEDKSLELEGKTCVLTANDFTRIMGIEDGEEEIIIPREGQNKPLEGKNKPRKGKKKPRKGKNKPLPTELELKRDFVKEGQNHICMEKVRTELSKGLDEDNVKRAYILFALRYIVCPPSQDLRLSYLDLVRDVSCLKKKRWATFAIDRLVKGIKTYKKSKGTIEIPLGGCTLFLQLYADKVSITVPKGPSESRLCGKRKRSRKTRDKEGSGSSSETMTIESQILEAKELLESLDESIMVFMEKCRKMNISRYKKDPFKLDLVEYYFSTRKREDEARSTEIHKTLEERLKGAGRN